MAHGAPDEDPVRSRTRDRAADLAAQYREAGWDALSLQPANTVPVPVGPSESAAPERDPDVGLSVLLPETEFDLLSELLASDAGVEVHRDSTESHLAVVVVVSDEDRGRALALPLSFERATSGAMRDVAREREELALLVRPANTDRRLELPLDVAAVLGPDDSDG